MKKKYIILNLFFLMIGFSVQAQVVNGNFETVKPNFLPSNWGMNFSQAITIDLATGQSTGDNILYTWCIPSMVYATTDAHTGQYAMEISNAYNQTQDKIIPGEVMIFSDATQDFPGWNPGVPVSPNYNLQTLGFYYKFLTTGNDVAEAKITVTDAEGNEIGKTHIDITRTNNQFHYVYSYVYLAANARPAFMYISFNMAKEGSTPTFGSRLIIDNVVNNFQSLGGNENHEVSSFSVYPTLADTEINIIPSNQVQGMVNYKIINAQGRTIKENTENAASGYVYSMDVRDLSAGMYFLQIASGTEKTTQKFIKR